MPPFDKPWPITFRWLSLSKPPTALPQTPRSDRIIKMSLKGSNNHSPGWSNVADRLWSATPGVATGQSKSRKIFQLLKKPEASGF